jgi:CBS domain containing-hemolysin-like protein
MEAPMPPGPWSDTLPGILAGLVTIPVFISLNAFFVAAEFALVSVRRTKIREMVEQNIAGARTLERTVAVLDRFLATTQLGITVASLGLGWLGEPALARAFLPVFSGFLDPGLSNAAAHSAALGVAFLGIAFMHITLGELVPRTVALRVPDRTALWLVGPLRIFEAVFRPFVWVLTKTGNILVKLMGFSPVRGREAQVHSVTEISLLMEASEKAGVIERREREMVHGVLGLGDLAVRQVMTPWADVVGVKLDDRPDSIVQTALECGYSRMPVFEGGSDEIAGVIYTKDLLSLYSEAEKGLLLIQDLLRQPFYVRTDAKASDLLREFQHGENHMALVRDEFGEIVGLVTIEDLLEEIVGEIRDEYDMAENPLKLERDGSFTVEGRASTRECLSGLGVVPPLWAGGSMSEFIARLNGGRIADGVSVVFKDLSFTVLITDASGALRIRIIKGVTGGGAEP